MRKNTKRLINPKKTRRKHKEAGIKKGSRDNSCNDIKAIHGTLQNGDTYSIDIITTDNSSIDSDEFNGSFLTELINREYKMREIVEELETVKMLIHYIRLTIHNFPEISKKMLYGSDLTMDEKLTIRRLEKEALNSPFIDDHGEVDYLL